MAFKKKLCFNRPEIPKITLIMPIFLLFIWYYTPLQSKSLDKNNYLDKMEAIELIIKNYTSQPDFYSIDLMIYESPIPPGAIIKPAYTSDQELQCNQESWLFVADFHPAATFAHDVEIGIINCRNQFKPDIIRAEWWPIKVVSGKNEPLYLSSKKWEKIILEFDAISVNSLSLSILFKLDFPFYVCPRKTCERASKDKLNEAEPNIKIYGTPSESGKLWAIIVCGYSENDNNLTFWYDAIDMKSTLLAYDVPENHIFFINPIQSNTELVSLIKTFLEKDIKGKIKNDEKLLFYISTHGRCEGNKTELMLESSNPREDRLSAALLVTLLNNIPCRTQFIVINACCSESFISPLIKRNPRSIGRVIITSSRWTSFSDLDFENCDGNSNDRGSEFLSGFIASFSEGDEADTDEDCKISIHEAFEFAKKYAFCADNDFTRNCCGFEPRYFPAIKYNNAAACKFLFWKEIKEDCPKKENK